MSNKNKNQAIKILKLSNWTVQYHQMRIKILVSGNIRMSVDVIDMLLVNVGDTITIKTDGEYFVIE